MGYEWRQRMNQPDELKECVKEFFEKYLDYREESDGGRIFGPIYISCGRALMMEPLSELIEKMRVLSGAEEVEE